MTNREVITILANLSGRSYLRTVTLTEVEREAIAEAADRLEIQGLDFIREDEQGDKPHGE